MSSMPLYRRSPDGDPAKARAAREALERGELPPDALERLGRKDIWTSDLSVPEAALTLGDGWRPRGLVMGSAVMRISWSPWLGAYGFSGYGGGYAGGWMGGWPSGGEIRELSRAAAEGWERCLDRLRLETEALGAHGAVGVRIKRAAWDPATGMAEFTAVGTAVSLPDAPALPQPFTSALSGIEVSKLLRAGYVPLAPVVGTCVSYITGFEAAQAALTWSNVPLQATSQTLAECRRAAADRMRAAAREAGAAGVVGVQLHMRAEEIEQKEPDRTDHLVECTALGTAVADLRAGGSAVPTPVIDLGR
jgi:uncharacterized protein YbjQ (UPF0145 family)